MAGSARMEVFRKANKHTLYPGEVDRRAPMPLQILNAVATSEAAETLLTAVTAQARYQDLFARITLSEAGWVGVGTGNALVTTGYLVQANQPFELPVRAGDRIAIKDIA